MTENAFGFFSTPVEVERAVENTIRIWNATYLREMERHFNLAPHAYENIKSYRAADSMNDRFPEQQIPSCQVMIADEVDIVTCANTVDAMFIGDIDILVQSTEPEPVRDLAIIYAWAIGMLLIQHPQLDKSLPISSMGWDKMGVPAVAKPEERWLAMGSIRVTILVEGMVANLEGPVVPTEEEPEGFPRVETVHLTEELLESGGVEHEEGEEDDV